MMKTAGALLQLRLDAELKHAFIEAARAQNATPSATMRDLIAEFVRETHRRNAKRQSRLVAAAPDAETTMNDIMGAQAGVIDD